MFVRVGNLRIHCKVLGAGAPVVLVHGWGCAGDSLSAIQDHLAKCFTVYALDLPGFGLSTTPDQVYGSFEYAEVVAEFIRAVKISNPILIGHSFGGKIIINLLGKHLSKVKKIILISSAGARLPLPLSIKCKIYFYKLAKFFTKNFFLKTWFEVRKKKIGSSDYRNASGIMRKILVKVINEDSTNMLPQINVPTLLLWGDRDTSTPLAAGKIMQEKIRQAELVVFPGSGHFPYKDAYEKVIEKIDDFLR